MLGGIWFHHRKYILTAILVMVSLGCNTSRSAKTLAPQMTDTATAIPSVTSQPAIVDEPTTPAPTVNKTAVEVPPSSTSSPTSSPTVIPTPARLRFAVIGDFGTGDQNEADVAALPRWGG